MKNLIKSLKKEKFDFEIISSSNDSFSLVPQLSSLPKAFPTVKQSGAFLLIKNDLDEKLRNFHEENKNEELFMEPSRTFATMVTFATKDFLSIPPEPEESRLRAYFDLNRDQFAPAPLAPSPDSLLEGEKGPTGDEDSNQSEINLNLVSSETADTNVSEQKTVLYEDVREEIRLRIIEEDRMDAEREAKEVAREKSLDFLDQINALRDEIKSKYSSFSKKRNSVELLSLLESSGGSQRKIAFAAKDMSVQAAILGLERRESERRKNREPLEEVASLNESLFFTRSTRTVRDGFSVFYFDRKTEKSAGLFEKASFADLYRGLVNEMESNAFINWVDESLSELQEGKEKPAVLSKGKLISVKGKNLSSVQSMYNTKNELLSSRLRKLEREREEIANAERESNSTKAQTSRKMVLDSLIEDLRVEQDQENQA